MALPGCALAKWCTPWCIFPRLLMLHLPQSSSAADVPAGASGDQLSAVARDLRYQVVQLSHRAGTPHLGSALSVIDVLVALYWRVARIDPLRPDEATRDRVIL